MSLTKITLSEWKSKSHFLPGSTYKMKVSMLPCYVIALKWHHSKESSRANSLQGASSIKYFLDSIWHYQCQSFKIRAKGNIFKIYVCHAFQTASQSASWTSVHSVMWTLWIHTVSCTVSAHSGAACLGGPRTSLPSASRGDMGWGHSMLLLSPLVCYKAPLNSRSSRKSTMPLLWK